MSSLTSSQQTNLPLSEFPILPEQIKYIEKDGEIWFTSEELAKGLGYASAREIRKIYERNSDELEEFSCKVKVTLHDGRRYFKRVFSKEGVYIISMLARTEKAKAFRKAVARLLRAIEEHRLELAREAGKKEAREALANMSEYQRRIEKKVIRYRQMGLQMSEIAKLLEVSKDTVSRTCRILRQAGWEV